MFTEMTVIFTLTGKNKKQKLSSVQPLNLRLLDESYA